VSDDESSKKIQAYDFRRPDRIAKDQLRAIHLLRENFARSLGQVSLRISGLTSR
jgi:flagellar motor switch protein FliM